MDRTKYDSLNRADQETTEKKSTALCWHISVLFGWFCSVCCWIQTSGLIICNSNWPTWPIIQRRNPQPRVSHTTVWVQPRTHVIGQLGKPATKQNLQSPFHLSLSPGKHQHGAAKMQAYRDLFPEGTKACWGSQAHPNHVVTEFSGS